MPVPKTDALPLGYTPYGLFWTIERGEEEGKSRDWTKKFRARTRGYSFILPGGPTTTSKRL